MIFHFWSLIKNAESSPSNPAILFIFPNRTPNVPLRAKKIWQEHELLSSFPNNKVCLRQTMKKGKIAERPNWLTWKRSSVHLWRIDWSKHACMCVNVCRGLDTVDLGIRSLFSCPVIMTHVPCTFSLLTLLTVYLNILTNLFGIKSISYRVFLVILERAM